MFIIKCARLIVIGSQILSFILYYYTFLTDANRVHQKYIQNRTNSFDIIEMESQNMA